MLKESGYGHYRVKESLSYLINMPEYALNGLSSTKTGIWLAGTRLYSVMNIALRLAKGGENVGAFASTNKVKNGKRRISAYTRKAKASL
jgi:hypothetical protein